MENGSRRGDLQRIFLEGSWRRRAPPSGRRGFCLALQRMWAACFSMLSYSMSESTTVKLALPRGTMTTRNGYWADRSGSGSIAQTRPETT